MMKMWVWSDRVVDVMEGLEEALTCLFNFKKRCVFFGHHRTMKVITFGKEEIVV